MGSWTYSYDALKRLTGASTPTAQGQTYYCWSYDSFGNRTGQTSSDKAFADGTSCLPQSSASTSTNLASFNAQNKMTVTNASGVLAYPTYDGAGDIMNDGKNQYLYDGDG